MDEENPNESPPGTAGDHTQRLGREADTPIAPLEAFEEEVRTRGPGRNLTFAIITGLTLAGLVIGLLIAGPPYFFGLAFIVILIAQAEFYVAAKRSGRNPATSLGIVAGGAMLIGSFVEGPEAIPVALFFATIFAFVWFIASDDRPRLAENMGVTILGIVYVPMLGSFAALLIGRPSQAAGVTLAMIGLAALYDVFAYAGGSRFGKTPLAPKISPHKTVEGALIATAGIMVLSGFLAPVFGPWNWWQAALLGFATSIAAPLGDLSESLLKRELGIKDMGTIFPGHGGALDRIDAILFVAPTVYFSLWLIERF